MNASLGMDLIRSLFATIDKAVYGLIKVLYDILLQLAETNIFNNENIQEFSARIYVFLGIIMLFKVTFSLIQYLINPESMTDKTNGTSNLTKNVIITLFLIIIVPYGFDLLYSAQSAIIKDNLIPRLVLGTEEDSLDNLNIIIDNNQCADNRNLIDNNGEYIALMTLRPFYQVYNGQTLSDNTKQVFCSAKSTDDLLIDEIYNAETGIGNSGQYIVDYSFFLSTTCGVLVMLLLLEFCFDVAMRCIKLGFLEIFAPVAIISFVDPKSAKSGTFSKWLKEVFGTWARLFVRLLILFFAIYIIKIVNENVGDSAENGMWIMLFLIIGALLFAKKAVPLIEDLLGIKFDHSIQLNPFKKIEDQALFGKPLIGAGKSTIGATAGMVGGGIAGLKAGSEVGATGRGLLVGALHGMSTGRANPKGAFSKSLDQTYKTLTGNEMVRLSIPKMIMSGKGSGEVEAIKVEIGKARDHLKIEEVRLNTFSNITAELGSALQLKGIDLNKLGATLPTKAAIVSELTSQQSALEQVLEAKRTEMSSYQQTYDALLAQYNKDKSFVENYKPMIIGADGKFINSSEFEIAKQRKLEFEKNNAVHMDKIKQLQAEFDKIAADLSDTRRNIGDTESIIKDISEYQKAYKQESESRDRINKINKDIKTLETEKAQRERFYQVDKTPRQSVEKAISSTNKRESDYGIIRDSEGKIVRDSVDNG